MDYLTNAATQPPRSTLLTVLCILTFIGSGYRIASSMFSLATIGKLANMEQQFKEAEARQKQKADSGSAKNQEFAQKIMEESKAMFNPQTMRYMAFAGIGAAILTLAGAILMWQRKMAGFYLYVAGCLAEVGIPFAVLKVGFLLGISTAVGGFFSLIFIVLYAFCIKELRPVKANIEGHYVQ